MLKYTFFIGCDISKEKLNFAIYHNKQLIAEYEIANTTKAIKALIKKWQKLPGFNKVEAIVCMEYTGIYNNLLTEALRLANYATTVVSGLDIKKSLGLVRGKNDVIDAQRIAQYAFRFQDELILFQPNRVVLKQLKELNNSRERMMKAKNQLKTPIQELKRFDKESAKLVAKVSQKAIKALEEGIKSIEKQINELIKNDQQLKENYKLASSVTGVGPRIAVAMILESGEFKKITEPKKMACHAGVAPFRYTSGSSINSKNKVSNKANKKLKKLLHMGAMSAIKVEGELKQYYERKIAEGKNKMSVINAIRNKLIHRVYAVVSKKVKYQKKYNINLQNP